MTFDEIKAITEYMESKGVLDFKAGDLQVRFGATKMPVEMTLEPDEMRRKELDDIKLRLEKQNKIADEEIFWSAE